MGKRNRYIAPAGSQVDSLGESPVWCASENAIYWIDWVDHAIRRLTSAGDEPTQWHVPERIGSMALRQKGGAVLAMQTGFYLFDFESEAVTFVLDPDPATPSHGLNDGKCDRAGRFWAGSIVAPLADLTPASPPGSLFCIDRELRCRRVFDGILISNGIAWSPDDRVIYFGDSGRRTIFRGAFDLDDGAIRDVSAFASVEGPAAPDGSCMDTDGCLWNAQYGAGQVVRYDPKGRVVEAIALPVTHPTSCTFGGEKLDQLYVTTARWKLTAKELAEQPLAGRMLVIDAGSTGLPDNKFAG